MSDVILVAAIWAFKVRPASTFIPRYLYLVGDSKVVSPILILTVLALVVASLPPYHTTCIFLGFIVETLVVTPADQGVEVCLDMVLDYVPINVFGEHDNVIRVYHYLCVLGLLLCLVNIENN